MCNSCVCVGGGGGGGVTGLGKQIDQDSSYLSYIGDCASGFGAVMDPSNYILPRLQVLIPSLHFTDSGHITAFHLAGTCGGGEDGVPVGDYIGTVQGCINILQVWRPSGGDKFSIAAIFTATLSVTYNTAVTASVTVDEPIPFSSGDVLGFTPGPIPGFFFQIASPSTAGNTHIYYTYNTFATELMTVGNDGVSTSPIISVEGTCAHATVDLEINVICVPHSMMLYMLHFVLQLAVWRCPPFSHLVMLLALVLDQVLA